MNTRIEHRLKATLRYETFHGDRGERAIVGKQIREAVDEITALRAALDQARTEVERLRAFAQGEADNEEWTSEADADAFCERMRVAGLIDDDGHPTALLSGRGDGGNDD